MKQKGMLLVVALLSTVLSTTAFSADGSKLPDRKKTKLGLYFTPQEAYNYVKAHPKKVLFLDVRTRAEVNFLGTPTITDANVPYMMLSDWYAWNPKKHSFKLDVNSDFATEVARRMKEKGLTKNDAIVLMCRSGDRSAAAANLLASLGYKKVYSVVSGYEGDKADKGPHQGERVVNGWKNAGLPWTYKLEKAHMYKVGSND